MLSKITAWAKIILASGIPTILAAFIKEKKLEYIFPMARPQSSDAITKSLLIISSKCPVFNKTLKAKMDASVSLPLMDF